MSLPLTAAADAALRRAWRESSRAGQDQVCPLRAVVCLLEEREAEASRLASRAGLAPEALLFRLRERLPQDAARRGLLHEAALSPEMLRLTDRAEAEALRLEDPAVGTDHLLLALARQPGVAPVLEELEAGYSRLAAALETLRREREEGRTGPRPRRDLPPPPRCVWALAALMLLQLLFTLFPFGAMLTHLLAGADSGGLEWLGMGWLACTVLTSLLLPVPLVLRVRCAWSGALGCLLVRTACLTGLMATGFVEAGRRGDDPALLMLLVFGGAPVALACGLTAGLFRARWWYGIGRREGWRVLLREGWWTLLLGPVFEAGSLLTLLLWHA